MLKAQIAGCPEEKGQMELWDIGLPNMSGTPNIAIRMKTARMGSMYAFLVMPLPYTRGNIPANRGLDTDGYLCARA